MGLLIDGEWRNERPSSGHSGEYLRSSSTYRHRVAADDHTRFPAVPGRYHLYVSRACPWCHRTMIARVFKRLENIISISFAQPEMLDNGWTFAQPDAVTGARYAHELYSQADPLYTGRATLPVL